MRILVSIRFNRLISLFPFSNKAVAEGAISFYLDRFVAARVARWTYGSPLSVHYDSSNAEHLSRRSQTYVNEAGWTLLPSGFKSLLEKVC